MSATLRKRSCGRTIGYFAITCTLLLVLGALVLNREHTVADILGPTVPQTAAQENHALFNCASETASTFQHTAVDA